MSTLEDRLADPGYRNWVKTGLCLIHVKGGLEKFVDQECKRLHKEIQFNIPGSSGATNVQHCTDCDTEDIKYKHDKKTRQSQWTIDCYNGICDKYLSEIVRNHVSPTSKSIAWRNSDITLWPVDHWEIAKCYMGPGQGGPMAVDTDISGILNLMIHCTWIRRKVHQISLCEQVRDVRNVVMHSTNLKISNGNFKKFTTCMIDLLEDQTQLKTLDETQTAVEQIRKIVCGEFVISLRDEQKMILEKMTTLENKCAELKLAQQRSEKDRGKEHKQLTKDLGLVRKMVISSNDLRYKGIAERQDKMDDTVEGLEKLVLELKQEITYGAEKQNREYEAGKLHESLVTAYRDCYTRISVSPLYDKRGFSLDQLYTDVVIIEDTNTMAHAEVPVKSYLDIFFDKDRKMRSIYILGDPGSGKTVYSQQMANTWINTQMKLASGVKQLEPNEEVMKEFRFLFYVPLRHLKKTGTLIEAVEESLPEREGNKEAAKQVLESFPESVLILCDGLDEIEGFPFRHHLHMFTVVTTTRPWKYDPVRTKTTWQDRVLKLRGIGETGIRKLVGRLLVTYYNDLSSETTTDKFIQSIDDLGLKQSLSDSPLILIYMLHNWYQTKSLSPSLTENLIGIIECLLRRSVIREKEKEKDELSQGELLLLRENFSLRSEEITGFLLGSISYKYGKVLMAAAEVAYRGLTNQTKEHTLVFSEDSLNEILSTQTINLQACLKVGILSKSEKFHVLHKENNVSFPHKLFQELFLSLYVANKESALEEFKTNHYNTVEKVLEMSQVLKFSTVLSPKTALQLSEQAAHVCSLDEKVLEFWSMTPRYLSTLDWVLRDLSKMYVSCLEEHNNVRPTAKCELHISDIYIPPFCTDVKWELLLQLIPFSKSSVRSFSVNYTDGVTVQAFLETFNSVPMAKTMKHICLSNIPDSDVLRMMPAINEVIANNTELTVLQLNFWVFGRKCILTGLHLPLLHHLQHLHLTHFPTTRDFLNQLTTLLALGNLKTLQLESADINDFYLDISHLKDLQHLALRVIQISYTLWCRMLDTMDSLPDLRELTITSPRLSDYGGISPQLGRQLNFVSRLHQMQLLDSGYSPVSQLILSSVTDGSQMRRLEVDWNDMPVSAVTSLSSTIQCLPYLEELSLKNIKIENQLSLENSPTLKTLELKAVTMGDFTWNRGILSGNLGSK